MAKVLLVEDDNNLREIYEARLTAEGYEISSASDGEEALVVAKQAKPDLVISDVMMPKISGFEMLDILRNTEGLEHVKVIMLTALGQNEDRDRADSLGADKYLVKSQVTLEDIVKTAHELLGEGEADTPTPVSPAAPSEAPTSSEPAVTAAAAAGPVPDLPVATPPVEEPVVPPPEEAITAPDPSPATTDSDSDDADATAASSAPTTDDVADTDTATPPAQPQTATTDVVVDENQDIAGSIAQEEALIQDQINNFAQSTPTTTAPEQEQTTDKPAETSPAPETTTNTETVPASAPVVEATSPTIEPVATEEPAVTPEEPTLAEPPVATPPVLEELAETEPTDLSTQENTAADDQLMADAVDELASESGSADDEDVADETPEAPSISEPESAPETTEETAPAAPEPPTEAEQLKQENDKTNISISGKKTIQPLDSKPKPDINELLAREEATGPDVVSGAAVVSSPDTDKADEGTAAEPAESPEIIHKPGQSFSPQPATESPVDTPVIEDDRPSGAPAPAPAQQKDSFDPNSIAL